MTLTRKKAKAQKLSAKNEPQSLGYNLVNQTWFGSCLIVILTFLVYWNSFSGKFVFDDIMLIATNRYLHQIWPPWDSMFKWGIGRPVVGFSFALNYALHGLDLWGYHAFNLFFHVCAALALWGCLRRTLPLVGYPALQSNVLSLLCALLWAVHPLQTASVTYIFQRCESLMGMFMLLSFYLAVRGLLSNRWKWFGLSVVCSALAMGCKQVAVVLPPLICLYNYLFVAGSWKKLIELRWKFYSWLCASWIVLSCNLAGLGDFAEKGIGFGTKLDSGGGVITPWSYLLTQFQVLNHYLNLCFWPHPLILDYGWPIVNSFKEVLPEALLILSLAGLTLWALWKRKPWSFLGVWFFGILSITSSFIPTRDPAFEHRMYLPLAAVVIGGVLLLHALFQTRFKSIFGREVWQRHFGIGLSAISWMVILPLLGWGTYRRNVQFADPVGIWEEVVKYRPNNERALINLGQKVAEIGKVEAASKYFLRALKLAPQSAEAHNNYGGLIYKKDHPEEAIAYFKEAIRLKPGYAEAHSNLGWAYYNLGQFQEVYNEYAIAQRLDPEFPMIHMRMGMVEIRLGRYQEALQHLEAAIRRQPENGEGHFFMGVALEFLGRKVEAVDHYRESLRIQPAALGPKANLNRLLSSMTVPAAPLQIHPPPGSWTH